MDSGVLQQSLQIIDQIKTWKDRVDRVERSLQPQQLERTIDDIQRGGQAFQDLAVFFEINNAIAAQPERIRNWFASTNFRPG